MLVAGVLRLVRARRLPPGGTRRLTWLLGLAGLPRLSLLALLRTLTERGGTVRRRLPLRATGGRARNGRDALRM